MISAIRPPRSPLGGCAFVLSVLCLAAPARATDLTIVYTGETHAMVAPCRCPISQDGGVARRAAAIEAVRRGGLTPTLVLDAGGQFGGSAYDEYAEGPAVDRERTKLHLRACKQMGYAAYAIGDEELQWGLEALREAGELGGAPFLSANLNQPALDAVGGRRYIIQDVGGVRIGVTAVTPGDLFALPEPFHPEGVSIGDPVEGLEAVLEALRPQTDLVVVLCHLGSDRTRELAAATSGVDIFINAHYRRPGGLVDRVNGALICEFNMEARSLSQLDLRVDGGEIRESRLREIPLDALAPSDPGLAAQVAAFEATRDAIPGPRVVIDYYTAWGCGYCSDLEPKLEEALRLFGPDRALLRRWFVVHPTEDGGFANQFGPESVAEARREIAVARLHGADVLGRYVALRTLQPDAEPTAAMRTLGLDGAAVEAFAAGPEVDRALAAHAERASRFRIPGTPTLYINNLEFDGDHEVLPLLRTLCGLMPEALKGEWCQGVPECQIDADCRQDGKIGRCIDAGTRQARCEFTDPPPLEVRVLSSPSIVLSNPRGLLGDLGGIFPGLTSRTVEYGSEEGQQLAALAQVRWLPAFFFSAAELELRPNLREVAGAFRRDGETYSILPLPQNTGLGGLDVTRERQEGKLDLFYRVLDPAALESVATFLSLEERSRAGDRFRLSLHPLLLVSPTGALAAEGGVAEIEEAARQAVVWRDHPERMLSYATLRKEAGNSSYWDTPLRMAGLDPESVRAAAQTDRTVLDGLYADAKLAEQLGFFGECVLLYANQELADVSSPQKAEEAAGRIGMAPTSVTILYTGNTNGQLEACRCPGNPYGGLSRQAEAITELRELYPNNITVDAGDMLAFSQDLNRFGYLQRAFAKIGFDAVAMGEQDFALGVDVLRGLATASPVPYVSANLALPELPVATKIVERTGVRIGILSLTSPRCFGIGADTLPAGATLEDPSEAAARSLPDLAAQSDILVCLFHGPIEDGRKLAERFPELDAVICGHEGASLQVPERVGKTWLLAPGRNGEWVGRLTLRLGEDGKAAEGDAQLIAMDDQIADHPEVAQIIAEYQADVQGVLRAEVANANQDPLSSPEACAACHAEEYAQWQTTPHAAAAETLRKLDREFDPSCWDCHSSTPLAAQAARVPSVTCVSCHRVAEPRTDGHGAVAPVAVELCLECHTEGKSPHFAYEPYLAKVTH